ncbi:MAG: XRE family transcriptional regulator [Microbacterium sp.]|uniref:helix-turn-helix domain-containing protein n=1 Tax=Microbacterium sp. TaxID=51671 RepID=UPI0039E618DE
MADTFRTPSALRSPADPDESARVLGARIRALRQSRGLTLAQAAADAELSHSFLSQVERGLERLSMGSLFRIARALGTTQQDLLTHDVETPPRRTGGFHVFRSGAGSPLDAGGGPVTVLAHGAPPFVPMIFEGSFDEETWWEHDEEEFVFVLDGSLTVALDDERFVLGAGDSVHYEGGVRHRWLTEPGRTCRVLVVKEAHSPRG